MVLSWTGKRATAYDRRPDGKISLTTSPVRQSDHVIRFVIPLGSSFKNINKYAGFMA